VSSVRAHAEIRPRVSEDAPTEPRIHPDRRIVAPHGLDRRVYPRLTYQELNWLREARMKYGPAVRLLDVSAGGALFETQARVCPNTDLVLHLIGHNLDTVVPSRVLRAQICALGEGPWYRSACAFRRSLDVTHLLGRRKDARAVDYLRAEFALKSIVDRYAEAHPDEGSESSEFQRMLDALRVLQGTAERRADPADRQLAELVTRALRALEGVDSIRAAMAAIEAHIRQIMPLVSIRVMSAPATPSDGAESIYFDVSASRRTTPGVLNIEFPAGFAPDSRQFRALKASAYLITLLRGFHPRSSAAGPSRSHARTMQSPVSQAVHAAAPAPADSPASATVKHTDVGPPPSDAAGSGWHPVVVRFVDGRLLRGYTNDFTASRSQLHLSPSAGASDDRLLVPLGSVKALFFVKDLAGDPTRVDRAIFDGPSSGRRIEVTFNDGEVLLGSTLNYDPARQGFFLYPADANGNNVRVYAISAAVRHARFVSNPTHTSV